MDSTTAETLAIIDAKLAHECARHIAALQMLIASNQNQRAAAAVNKIYGAISFYESLVGAGNVNVPVVAAILGEVESVVLPVSCPAGVLQ